MVHGSWLFIHGHFWARLLQLVVVTVFSAPPFPMELQRQERKSEKKGTGCERAVTAISHTGNEICDNHG